jgi:hypothetical protein
VTINLSQSGLGSPLGVQLSSASNIWRESKIDCFFMIQKVVPISDSLVLVLVIFFKENFQSMSNLFFFLVE